MLGWLWLAACHSGGEDDSETGNAQSAVADALYRDFTGSRVILFVPLKYPGEEPLLTDEQISEHAAIVEAGFDANALGKADFDVEVSPVIDMPQSGTYYETGPSIVRIRADAVAALGAAQFDADDYDLLVLFSTQHWPTAASGIGALDNKTALMNKNLPEVTLHEVGHAMGFGHANLWVASENDPFGAGEDRNYEDKYDVMGGPGGGEPYEDIVQYHFAPWFKLRSGWSADSVIDVTQSGTYALPRYEETGASLRIRRSADTDLWVTWRTDTGEALAGPLLTWTYRTHNINVMQSRLIDLTPGSQPETDWRDAALVSGATVSTGDLTLSATSDGTDGLNVTVGLGEAPTSLPPRIEFVTPVNGTPAAGNSFTYEVRACDPDHGDLDGSGIVETRLYLYLMFDDDLLVALRDRQELPGYALADAAVAAPPYRMTVDTTALDDEAYVFIAEAESEDGEVVTLWRPHLIDNAGPSQ